MGKMFVLITQITNHSNRRLGFRVDGEHCSLPELPRGKTRMVKLSLILRQFREFGPNWKVRVLVDGHFKGIELDPRVFLHYVRVIFSIETNGSGLDVVCVDGVRETSSDYLLRHRYFGCMRNFFWDGRPSEKIARWDSRLPTKLRNLEDNGQHLASFVDTTLAKRQFKSPYRESDRHEENPTEEKSKRDPPVSPAVDKNDDIKSQPNVTAAIKRENPMIVPVSSPPPPPPPLHRPPPPPPPPPAPRQMSRGLSTVSTGNPSADTANNMDSFVHAILFLFALSLVQLLPMLFQR